MTTHDIIEATFYMGLNLCLTRENDFEVTLYNYHPAKQIICIQLTNNDSHATVFANDTIDLNSLKPMKEKPTKTEQDKVLAILATQLHMKNVESLKAIIDNFLNNKSNTMINNLNHLRSRMQLKTI